MPGRREPWFAIALASSACFVDPQSSAEGKPCPCPAPLRCDEATQSCTASPPPCVPRFTVSDFGATWTTPESIRWSWTPPENRADFFAYTLVLGTDEAAVTAGVGDVVRVDAATNPELGHYIAVDQKDARVVDFTITDQLSGVEGGKTYYARLEAVDVLGCTSTTPVASARTSPPPTQEIVLFRDAVELFGLPCTFVAEPGCGIDGSSCLRCQADGSATGCLTPPGSIATNGFDFVFQRVDQWAAVPTAAIEDGTAFLEIGLALLSTRPAYYLEAALLFRPPATAPNPDATCVALDDKAPDTELATVDYDCFEGPWKRLDGLRARATSDGTYQRIQIPLNRLHHAFDPTPVPTSEIVDGRICAFTIGSEFPDATEVRIDDVAIRW